MPAKILVVDDEPSFIETVNDIFEEEIKQGYYQLSPASNGQEAWETIKGSPSPPDLILTDVRMPELDGLALTEKLKQEKIFIRSILISAYVSLQDVEDFIDSNSNILEFFTKTQVDISQLKKTVQEILSSLIQVKEIKIFDYSILDKEISQFIQQQTLEIRTLMRRTAQSIIEVGTKLHQVKAKLEHGQFINWLNTEFEWSYPLALKFMQVAERFKSINFMNLSIAPSALYLLAAPSTDDRVRQEALERAQAGEPISYTLAKELKAKYAKETPNQSPQKTPTRQRQTTSKPDKAKEKPSSNPPSQKPAKPSAPKIVALRSQQNWWQLGEKHYLFAENPNSSAFRAKLPENVAVTLSFPLNLDWRLEDPNKAKTTLAFHSVYEDLDLNNLREMIRQCLLVASETNEIVVFAFLPDPELLLLADALGCRCFIAEPDLIRCEAAIAVWQKAGGTVVKIS